MRKMKMLGAASAMLGAGLVGSAAYADDFVLQSPNVRAGENVAPQYLANAFGCSGQNIRPDFTWSAAPAGTKSFAMSFYDRDADTGSGFWHWVMVDIPASSQALAGDETPSGAKVKANDTSEPTYLGPCPPVGQVHNYVFTLHALDVDKLEAPDNSTAPLTGYYVNMHTLAKASIVLPISRSE